MRSFPVAAFGVDGFNIDDRCAQILGSYRAIPRDVRRAVAKECERLVLDHIERGQSFAVETTLRTTAAIDQAVLAQRNGFVADMQFVATDSIDENVARVVHPWLRSAGLELLVLSTMVRFRPTADGVRRMQRAILSEVPGLRRELGLRIVLRRP